MAWWKLIVSPVANLFTKALDIVDDIVPDKDLAAKLKASLTERIHNIAHTEFIEILKARASIIIAEATGKSWLQRNWRPLTMFTFVIIIANNYIIAPYIGLLFGGEYKLMLEIPSQMWSLLTVGMGGYIVGRSAEKIADGDGLKGAVKKVLDGMK